MDSTDYEKVVAEIAKSLVRQVEGRDDPPIGWGPTNKIQGASGHKHQIDVSYNDPAGNLFLVECKYWNSLVEAGGVLTFLGRIVDIKKARPSATVLGAMATTIGYQSGALLIANYWRIDPQLVRSPDDFGMKYKTLFVQGIVGQSAGNRVGELGLLIEDGEKQ